MSRNPYFPAEESTAQWTKHALHRLVDQPVRKEHIEEVRNDIQTLASEALAIPETIHRSFEEIGVHLLCWKDQIAKLAEQSLEQEICLEKRLILFEEKLESIRSTTETAIRELRQMPMAIESNLVATPEKKRSIAGYVLVAIVVAAVQVALQIY